MAKRFDFTSTDATDKTIHDAYEYVLNLTYEFSISDSYDFDKDKKEAIRSNLFDAFLGMERAVKEIENGV